MTTFDTYRNAFPNARLKRKPNGVLEVALHTDGGKLVFNGHTHEQFVDMFHAIGEDRDNRVVILTGRGDAFMDTISPEGFDFFSPAGLRQDPARGPQGPLEHPRHRSAYDHRLEWPGVVALRICAADRHRLATPDTVFQDKPHFDFGIVPGDGSIYSGRRLSARSAAAISS